ncbi:MAG: HIT family protein [Bacteroidota bacterium]
MASIFSKIVSKEIPCFVLQENDEFLAFLDVNPLVLGHTLVIPKKEIDYIFDLDDDTLQRMILFSKVVARKLKDKFPCKKIGVTVVGLEVPHAHIHLIPINSIDDMNFSREKLKLSQDQLWEIQNKILS